MGLQKYIGKRDFTKTTEPKSGRKTTKSLQFVVQRHQASHLHYDFRLEMEGVLKSWAIPKGPSLNPEDKRLAIMVEDHPYDYRTFEGIIPEGNYGAGVVSIFDEGTYEALEGKNPEKELLKELHSGNLKFRLHGKILKGEFALVKIRSQKDNSWLLIKHKDEFAVNKKFDSEALVSKVVKKKTITHNLKDQNKFPSENLNNETSKISYEPMLAKLALDVFDDPDWIYERKVDGYRAIACTGKNIQLISRKGIDFKEKYKPITEALSKFKNEAVIDGELVVEDQEGKSYFQAIQNYNPANKKFNLKYYVFDLLVLDGHDLRQMELIKRKALLKTLISQVGSNIIVYNDHIIGQGKKFLAQAEKKGWEGIMAKQSSSIYQSGKRSDSWLKFKMQASQEAVIIGFSKPAGSRKYFGALVLGVYENDTLVYIGNCGTGFNEDLLKGLYEQLIILKTDKKPVKEKVQQERNVTWVIPRLVCEVTYAEWTADKRLRHPVFKGLRTDKTYKEVRKETLDIETMNKNAATIHEMPDELEEIFGDKKVKLTHLNKLYWQKEGITKGQLIHYYRNMADYILPYLKDCPLSLNRHPNGINAPSFFQKDLDTEQIPAWIKYAPLFSESNNKYVDYLICNDLSTLLWMANLGCIEINPWLSTYKKPEKPIFAVMDLDPQDVDFNEVVKVALTARTILKGMHITPYIKTSGSRGLHIFIYIGAMYDYELARKFIQHLGRLILAQHPDTTSLERSPSKRKNKIYLDFLQNSRGQTIAAPYSVRPKPGATVSTPLEWIEVDENLDFKKFTLFNTLQRLKEKGDLWKDITETKADLKKALATQSVQRTL